MIATKQKKPANANKRTKEANGKAKPIKDASPANGSDTHQDKGSLLPSPPQKPPIEKDELGRFLPGNNGGPGRPPGSRNKLVEDFISDFHDAWKENGAAALKKMVADEPAGFVRAAVQLMPKDVLVEARGAGLLVVETPAAIKALLEALPDLGVLPLNGSARAAIAFNGEPGKPPPAEEVGDAATQPAD